MEEVGISWKSAYLIDETQPARSVAGGHVVHTGGGSVANQQPREGGTAPRTWLRRRSSRRDRDFSHVRTNGRWESDFPRVQRIGEPPDIILGGGEGDFPA